MNLDCDKLINEFKETIVFLANFSSNENFDYKSSSVNYCNKLGRKIEKISQKLIVDYLEEFIKLLDDENIIISVAASTHLYPIFPKKCMKILKKYYSQLTDEIDKIGIKMAIEGYSKKEKALIDVFKKSFKTDDLDSLNRER